MTASIDWIIAGALLAAMLLVFLPLMMMFQARRNTFASVVCKALGSACAVSLAVYGAAARGGTVSWIIAAAVAVCLVADVVICSNFIYGMGVFFAAQILYITAMCMTAPPQLWSAIVFVPVYLCALAAFWGVLKNMGAVRFAYLVYAAALLGAMSIAAALPASIGAAGILPAAAGGLFACSDLILAKAELVSNTRGRQIVLMLLYYAAIWCYAAHVCLSPTLV